MASALFDNMAARGEPFHWFDLHVHTLFSDGQRNLDEIIQHLIANNIKIVGFADHVFPGAYYKHGKTLANCFSASVLQYRKGVLRMYDAKYPEIEILNGAEIDLYPRGRLTLPRGVTPDFFDYLLVSKHHTLPKEINLFGNLPKFEKWLWNHNPRLRLNRYLWQKELFEAFRRYKPDVFAHVHMGCPKYLGKDRIKRFVLMCKKFDVAIELNHFPKEEPQFQNILKYGRKYGAKFSLASDFHGFSGDFREQLNHSQEMYQIAKECNLNLLDPWKLVERKNRNLKEEELSKSLP